MMANSGTLALIAWLLPVFSFLVLALVFPFRRLGRPAAWFSTLCAAGAFASAVMAWRIQSVAAHPVHADERVHDRVLERVPHVQRAGDVRRRQLDAERRPGRVERRRECIGGGPEMEYAARFPTYTQPALDAFARAKLSPPVRNTTERHQQLVAA